LELKPNRLVGGTGVHAFKVDAPAAAALLIVWAVVVALALVPLKRRRPVLALCAAALAGLTVYSVGAGGARLVAAGGALSRVSFGPGLWLSIVSTYVVGFAAIRSGRGAGGWDPLGRASLWAAALLVVWYAASGGLAATSLAMELAVRQEAFGSELGRHVWLSGFGTVLATALAIPLGVFCSRRERLGRAVMAVVSAMQTVPTLALFGFLIVPLAALAAAVPTLKGLGVGGIGPAPALVALTAYGLLPIVRNTYTALIEVDPSMKDAGRGMGMTSRQLFWRVELPVASPLVLQGVRTSAVQVVGLAALGAFIGAGGLGVFIIQGVGQTAPDLTLLGALPTIALAVVADRAMAGLARVLTPRGLGRAGEAAEAFGVPAAWG
jgi:osmoprotectant transport system permease protein